MAIMNDSHKPRIIAYYLPQYHPTKHNDEWWGKGFTEWTNVGKAKRLFPGHYQPRVPADLGYYDLRLAAAREAQASLAKEAGIEGFCYYHYWFGEGREELEFPFDEVVNSGSPDLPFCLCWANESWHSKFWNKDGKAFSKKVLVEQKYCGSADNERHFYRLLSAFSDNRYIKIKGRLLFVIYKPLEFHALRDFIKQWNDLAIKNDLSGFYFVGVLQGSFEFTDDIISQYMDIGLDGINIIRMKDAMVRRSMMKKIIDKASSVLLKIPRIVSYKKASKYFVGDKELRENVFPTIIPNWDHSPRSGRGAFIITNSTPALFAKHIDDVFNTIKHKNNKLIFLKSWNEWGEGNYMEPDLVFGKQYIKTLKSKVDAFNEMDN